MVLSGDFRRFLGVSGALQRVIRAFQGVYLCSGALQRISGDLRGITKDPEAFQRVSRSQECWVFRGIQEVLLASQKV